MTLRLSIRLLEYLSRYLPKNIVRKGDVFLKVWRNLNVFFVLFLWVIAVIQLISLFESWDQIQHFERIKYTVVLFTTVTAVNCFMVFFFYSKPLSKLKGIGRIIILPAIQWPLMLLLFVDIDYLFAYIILIVSLIAYVFRSRQFE